MSGRRRHVIDLARMVCVKCGREIRRREDTRCAFLFSPRWLPHHRQGQARIRREIARLRRRGLLEDNESVNIVGGHARPWPDALFRREAHKMIVELERKAWAFAGLPPASTRSTGPTLRYEDLVALWREFAPPDPPALRVTYAAPDEIGGGEREFVIPPHQVRMLERFGWRILKPKIDPGFQA